MRYRTTTLAVAGGLLPTSAQAAAGCQVTYTTNDWSSGSGQGGFTANVTAASMSYNGALAGGASTSIGFNGIKDHLAGVSS
ncbi:hypothetical protein [Dactylosporangium sp. CA-233914]|uniref:hypothetical protein n=1 Tax=Dactylosporangium sp. CA-233914 TaxID=3239934 RepID=UPI003D902900